jgi:hypothetical protein
MASATTADSNRLLVDFPSSPKVKRSVRFVDQVDGIYIEYPTPDENMKRWYTEEDRKRFRRQMGRDAAACSFIVFGGKLTGECQGKMEMLRSQDIITCCVGLEHLISKNVVQRSAVIKTLRKDHASRVVKEQARLIRCRNESIQDRLAFISTTSSSKSQKKAYNVAKFIASIV